MRQLKVPFAAAMMVIVVACATMEPGSQRDEEQAITAVLNAQQAAWNRGDIDAFMDGYVRGDALRFASGGTVTRGWQSTLDRYKARYRDRSIMGALTFSGIEVDPISADAALVHGAWALQRSDDAPSGLFTLLFRKTAEGEWRIVSDTTTLAD
ncbi:MAG: DUF4440 domain-containing protein [Pseudomonadota bacterium]